MDELQSNCDTFQNLLRDLENHSGVAIQRLRDQRDDFQKRFVVAEDILRKGQNDQVLRDALAKISDIIGSLK
jgi:hypothetical protein